MASDWQKNLEEDELEEKVHHQAPSHGGGHVETFEDPLEHLWAISYADMLMVMLCFFVLYFNPDAKQGATEALTKKDGSAETSDGSALQQIAPKLAYVFFGEGAFENNKDARPKNMNEEEPTEEAVESPTKSEFSKLGTGESDTLQGALPFTKNKSEIIEALKGIDINVDIEEDKNHILVHFRSDAYSSGKYDLSENLRRRMSKILSVLEAYKDQVDLVFIGHADDVPISARLKAKGVRSNMVLSALRAAVAAEYTIESGMDPKQVRTEGTGEFGRSSRTLTIRIDERG